MATRETRVCVQRCYYCLAHVLFVVWTNEWWTSMFRWLFMLFDTFVSYSGGERFCSFSNKQNANLDSLASLDIL